MSINFTFAEDEKDCLTLKGLRAGESFVFQHSRQPAMKVDIVSLGKVGLSREFKTEESLIFDLSNGVFHFYIETDEKPLYVERAKIDAQSYNNRIRKSVMIMIKGSGAVQRFIKDHGGKKFLLDLREKSPLKSAAGVAKIICEDYDFYCTDSTMRRMFKQYGLKLCQHGGSRRIDVK